MKVRAAEYELGVYKGYLTPRRWAFYCWYTKMGASFALARAVATWVRHLDVRRELRRSERLERAREDRPRGYMTMVRVEGKARLVHSEDLYPEGTAGAEVDKVLKQGWSRVGKEGLNFRLGGSR